jgi:hypothetical protein
MSLWDRLLPQTEITVNLLRQSNATPTVSAYAHLSGPFDYNKMPLAPMGCAVQIHEKTDKRGTWAYHSLDGWYIATSPEHYRTHTCHVKSTRSERLTDTVQFQHKNITNPTVTHADKIMKAIADCAQTIKSMQTEGNDIDMRQLSKLEELTRKAIDQIPTIAQAFPKIDTAPLPRVPVGLRDDDTRQTRSTMRHISSFPRVETQAVPRVERSTSMNDHAKIVSKKKRAKARRARIAATTDAPASNTRSKTSARSRTATNTATSRAPRVDSLRQTLRSTKSKTQEGKASAV